MSDFMKTAASKIWPPDKRIGMNEKILDIFPRIWLSVLYLVVFCYMARGNNGSCNAKEGNPFGPFWDTFDIDFVDSEFYEPLHYDVYHSDMAEQWLSLIHI